ALGDTCTRALNRHVLAVADDRGDLAAVGVVELEAHEAARARARLALAYRALAGLAQPPLDARVGREVLPDELLGLERARVDPVGEPLRPHAVQEAEVERLGGRALGLRH